VTRRSDRADPFLDDLVASEGTPAVELLRSLLGPHQSPAASAALRERLLASAVHEGRLWRFAERIAELLDISIERARVLLDQLDDLSVWTQTSPGIALFWVDGGPRVQAAARGFVRIAAGVRSPEHEHLGQETMFVLQGAFRDLESGQVARPGDTLQSAPGSSHAIEALADGPDMLQLAIVQTGVRIGGKLFGPP
jgi:quercetin dioxygenase-like cupin family protein